MLNNFDKTIALVLRTGGNNRSAKWVRVNRKWRKLIHSYDSFIEEICPTEVGQKRKREMRLNAMLPEELLMKLYKEYLFRECIVHVQDILITYHRFTVVDWSPTEAMDYFIRTTTILKDYDAGKRQGFGWFQKNEICKTASKLHMKYRNTEFVELSLEEIRSLGFN